MEKTIHYNKDGTLTDRGKWQRSKMQFLTNELTKAFPKKENNESIEFLKGELNELLRRAKIAQETDLYQKDLGLMEHLMGYILGLKRALNLIDELGVVDAS